MEFDAKFCPCRSDKNSMKKILEPPLDPNHYQNLNITVASHTRHPSINLSEFMDDFFGAILLTETEITKTVAEKQLKVLAASVIV